MVPVAQSYGAAAGVRWLGISALMFSLLPVSLAAAGSTESPLAVAAGLIIGSVASVPCWPASRRVGWRSLLASRSEWGLSGRAQCLIVAAVAASGLDFAMFSTATAALDPAAVSALFEMWPIYVFWWLVQIDRSAGGGGASGQAQRPGIGTSALMAVGALGAATVVYATGGPDQSAGPGFGWGVLIAAAAPFVSALGTATQIPAERVRRSARHAGDPAAVQSANIAAFWLGRAMAAPVVLSLGFLESSDGLLGRSEFWLAIVAGAIVHAPATVATRVAVSVTTVRRIVAVQYCSPVLALLWLAAFWGINVDNACLLAAGTVAIAAANTALATGRFASDAST